MKKTRKILAMVCALALTAALAVGGTFAYLTATTDVVENTFTVGKVAITLDEAKVDAYGVAVAGADRVIANQYKLIPGHNYVKDPTVHVDATSETCWLFVKVVNGIAAIEAEGDTTIAKQMETKGWVAVPGAANYFYKENVIAGANEKVFDTFTLADGAAVEGYANATITIAACAVQDDGLDTVADAWAAVPAAFKQ